MADLATLQARLAEAEAAQHKLLIGCKAVKVDQGDKAVTYTEAKASALAAYIASLKAQIGALTGACAAARRPLLARF